MSNMTSGLAIRSAAETDAGLIMNFIRELAVYEKLLHEVEATEADITRELFGASPRVFCEIAEWDGAPIGFALWYYTFSTFRGRHGIWLEDLYVSPTARGKGVGKALMATLAERCAKEELARLEWWVLDWNKTAIDFYTSLGAKMQDEWTVCRVDGDALRRLGGQK